MVHGDARGACMGGVYDTCMGVVSVCAALMFTEYEDTLVEATSDTLSDCSGDSMSPFFLKGFPLDERVYFRTYVGESKPARALVSANTMHNHPMMPWKTHTQRDRQCVTVYIHAHTHDACMRG